MNVAVIGAGYVGLVTAACLADLGNRILCVENNPGRLAMLCDGIIPIYEEGLAELVDRNVAAGRLRFTADLPASVRASDILFLCVGTPPGPGGQPDLSQIETVATSIGEALDDRYHVIVTKSTVPVGCGDWVSQLVRDAHASATWRGAPARQVALIGVAGGSAASPPCFALESSFETPADPPNFDVVSNPEFLREGSAIRDMMFPDRIVLGSASPRAIDMLRELYRPILEQRFDSSELGVGCSVLGTVGPEPRTPTPEPRTVPLVDTDLASAEMIKYAANAFLATKISFINEIANICERTGADVRAVAQGIGLDHRIGEAFLQAGIGWGGSCFPKDVAALEAMATDYGYEARLLTAVREVNARQRLLVVQKLQERLKILKGKTIGLLGLAFKPGTDDLRDAPALTLAHRLMGLGAKVRAYDPHAAVSAAALLPGLVLAGSVEHVALDADALVLVTAWPEFQELPFARLARRMRCPLIVDGRNCLDREAVIDAGFEYVGIGR